MPAPTTSRRPAARSARSAAAQRAARTRAANARARERGNWLNYPRARARGVLRWWPSLRLVAFLALLGLVTGLALVVLAYRLVDVPTEETAQARYRTSTVFYSDGTTEMATLSKDSIDRQPLKAGEIPDTVADAIIASEDRSFRSNRGVSLTGVGRAVYGVVTGRDLGGGSTITQQYVKNAYGDDSPTYARKVREAIIAVKVDQRVSKPEILASYLNTIYFGRGAYGIQSAAQQYFGIDAAQLTHEQAALLVGLVPAPSAYEPRTNPAKAQERYDYVMASMVETGAIPAAEARDNPTMPETVEPAPPQGVEGPNGYVVQQVRAELAEAKITQETLDTAGLNIVLTIDKRLQDEAVATMQDPDVYPPVATTEDPDPSLRDSRPATLQAGLISIDPATGGVKAMYAGADASKRPFNALTQDEVQAGSTFKPFTLIAALESGKTLSSTLDGSSPRAFPPGYPASDPLRNFGNENPGRVNLVEATAKSVNTAYVQLNQEVGPEKTTEVAERMGIPAESLAGQEGNLSNVLGTATVHPWDLATAYATMAAQGQRHTTHVVASVTRIDDGKAVLTADPTGDQVVDPSVIADSDVAMQAVVQRGSGTRARALGRPVAGKTGTTSDNKAAWFSAFTPQLSTTVVMFNPADGSDPAVKAGTELSIPGFGGVREVVGGTYPAAIWTAYMRQAVADDERLDFPEPTRRTPSRTQAPTRTSAPSTTQQPTTRAPTSEPTSEPSTTEPTDGVTTPSPSGTSPTGTSPTGEPAPGAPTTTTTPGRPTVPAPPGGTATVPPPGGDGTGGGQGTG